MNWSVLVDGIYKTAPADFVTNVNLSSSTDNLQTLMSLTPEELLNYARPLAKFMSDLMEHLEAQNYTVNNSIILHLKSEIVRCTTFHPGLLNKTHMALIHSKEVRSTEMLSILHIPNSYISGTLCVNQLKSFPPNSVFRPHMQNFMMWKGGGGLFNKTFGGRDVKTSLIDPHACHHNTQAKQLIMEMSLNKRVDEFETLEGPKLD